MNLWPKPSKGKWARRHKLLELTIRDFLKKYEKESAEELSSSHATSFRVLQQHIMRITIFIAALILLGAGVVLSFMDLAKSAGVTYGAAVLCLIFVFLPQFKRFKGFGVEAELLEKKIEEADEIIKRLREISVPVAEMLFTLAARMGRWGSQVPRHERYRMMKRIDEGLRNTGATDEQLEEAKREWHRYNMIDLNWPIRTLILDILDKKINETHNAIQRFPQPIDAGDPDHTRLIEELRERKAIRDTFHKLYLIEEIETLPSAIESFVNTCNLLTEQEKEDAFTRLQEEMEDLKHYAVHHDFRRLEVWFDEDEK